jgi:hypothetical protein
MAEFAIIINGVVDNYIVADTLEIAKAVSSTDALVIPYSKSEPFGPHIGYAYDEINGFEQPPVSKPEEPLSPK